MMLKDFSRIHVQPPLNFHKQGDCYEINGIFCKLS